MKKLIFPFLILFYSSVLFAQDTLDYYNPSFMRFENHVYKPSIKTVILERSGLTLTDPVIQLKSSEKLNLSFDELSNDTKDYSYKWIHCDANWDASTLSENDYIDGFFTDHIVSYRHSFNTTEDYYHYAIEFPNENMRPLISGNYLLVVFETSEPDIPIITRRFWVVESKVEIQATIHRATDLALRNSHQEVDFKILTGNLKIVNPYSDVKVVIVQNNRWKDAIIGLKPQFALDGVLEYNYEEGNIFEGGNEFRNFDIRSVRFQTQFIENIALDGNTHRYDVTLKPEVKRSSQRYSTEEDINGRFLIKVYEGRDGDLEGEYVNVHFTLPNVEEADSGNYYLYGQLTDWNIVPWAKMEYNDSIAAYTRTLLLKQGYYNYEYLFLSDENKNAVVAAYEGNHYETGNDYDFYVYLHETGSRYDRLIGYRKVDSRKQ